MIMSLPRNSDTSYESMNIRESHVNKRNDINNIIVKKEEFERKIKEINQQKIPREKKKCVKKGKRDLNTFYDQKTWRPEYIKNIYKGDFLIYSCDILLYCMRFSFTVLPLTILLN